MTGRMTMVIWLGVVGVALLVFFLLADLPIVTGAIIIDAPYMRTDGTMGLRSINDSPLNFVSLGLGLVFLVSAFVLWRRERAR